ncbi:hypothetical protein [Priestia megaterium]|uniref:hypothetical protein n=1 Tax=Priestia megaterium TaxID=1404 RepID=UPI000BFD6BAA|nr:hypothetical protein [Priestia megaterium]PGQ88158.1 hypothetical protein COA18_04340 [Priestia megaterium]
MNDLYFKGEAEKLIFFIVELDGETRMKKLGITQYHYRNKNYALKWYEDLMKIINPNHCEHPKVQEAINELNKMYKSMVGCL